MTVGLLWPALPRSSGAAEAAVHDAVPARNSTRSPAVRARIRPGRRRPRPRRHHGERRSGPSSQARRSTSANTSTGWAPETPYFRSTTKNGTPPAPKAGPAPRRRGRRRRNSSDASTSSTRAGSRPTPVADLAQHVVAEDVPAVKYAARAPPSARPEAAGRPRRARGGAAGGRRRCCRAGSGRSGTPVPRSAATSVTRAIIVADLSGPAAVLAGQHLGHRLDRVLRGCGVQLEGAVDDLDLVACGSSSRARSRRRLPM